MRTAKKAGQRESSTTAFAGGSEADSSSAPDAGDIIGLDRAHSAIGVRVHVGDDPASTPTKSRPAAARPTADAPTLPTREVRRALRLLRDGEFGRACAALTSAGLHDPGDPHVLQQLRDRHFPRAHPVPGAPPPLPAFQVGLALRDRYRRAPRTH